MPDRGFESTSLHRRVSELSVPGVPESPQFGVFLPQRQALGIALFKFGQGSGAQGIGTDFVDHRRILQVTGPARGTPAYRQPILTLMVSRVHPMAGAAQL